MDSSTVRLRFAGAKVSVALPKIAISPAPGLDRPGQAASRSAPAPDSARPVLPRQFGQTSSASASCGTHFGCTKLVASTTGGRPSTSRWMNSTLTSALTIRDSFCSPSRGPTSQIVTRSGSPAERTTSGNPAATT